MQDATSPPSLIFYMKCSVHKWHLTVFQKAMVVERVWLPTAQTWICVTSFLWGFTEYILYYMQFVLLRTWDMIFQICNTISEDLCHWVFMNVLSCTEETVSRMWITLNTVTTKNNCLCFQASVCMWQQYCCNKYRFCATFKSAKNLCITCTA